MATSKLSGHDAIEYAERTGATLHKYADPIEGARDSLTIDEARQVAREDASLIWVSVSVDPCDGCGAPATVSTDIGGGVAWWCKACSEEADDRAIAAYEARLEGLAELP